MAVFRVEQFSWWVYRRDSRLMAVFYQGKWRSLKISASQHQEKCSLDKAAERNQSRGPMNLQAVWTELDLELGQGRRESLRRDDLLEREREFASIVERQAQFMFRVAYSLLRNPHDAEDAVQEAFLKLYRGEAWRRMEDERAFLARTVWRLAMDRARRSGVKMQDVTEMELAGRERSPEGRAADEDQRALLRQLIDALPAELRQPLLLSAVEEMTSREIAAAMGIPEGTVRTRLMRARAELKKRFQAMEARR